MLALTVAGLALAVAPWCFEWRLRRRVEQREHPRLRNLSQTGGQPQTAAQRRWGRQILLFASLVVFLGLGSVPVVLAQWLGFLACAVLALASFVVLVGVSVVYLQDRPPPQIFRTRVLPLHSTPVLSLLIITVFLGSLAANSVDIHGVRGLSAAAPKGESRPTLTTTFDDWVAGPGCDRVMQAQGRYVRVRPMVLVAAKGGGIRATYWTALGMEQIAGAGAGCGQHATLFSSGASGGAVGLSVARFTHEPVQQVKQIAGPDALGAAAIGLFVRDVVNGTTGLPLPNLGDYHPKGTDEPLQGGVAWLDRSALMESVWRTRSAALRSPFVTPGQAGTPVSEGVTGQLALVSTTVGGGCRALLSQLALPQPSTEPTSPANGKGPFTDPRCDRADGVAPHSIDLFATYGSSRPEGASVRDGDGCLADVEASTAALLASRFPYVTSAGVVGRCGPWSQQQLVDGGYTENTGIGTIVDLAPQWQQLVRENNREVLSALGNGTPASRPFVYPVVVYLDNGYGADVSAATKVTSELLIPPTAAMRAGKAQAQPPALLRRAAALVDTSSLCDPTVPRCISITETLAPRRVFVVHPATTPSVTAPLGWVLSDISQTSMNKAMTAQATTGCAAPQADPSAEPAAVRSICADGYGSMQNLVELLAADDPVYDRRRWTRPPVVPDPGVRPECAGRGP